MSATPARGGPLEWTGRQLGQVSDALRDAYTYAALSRLLLYRLERRIEDIAFGDDLEEVVFKVLTTARAQGWIDQLVTAAAASNPGNARMARVVQELGLGSTSAADTALERIVSRQGVFHDVAAWRARLGELEGRVCRVEVPTSAGTAMGTGFLVGPDLVLTNHHVVEAVIDSAARQASGYPVGRPDAVRCRFDYKRWPDGTVVDPGAEQALSEDWLVDSSPMSPADSLPDPKPSLPTTEELDYALLRLRERIGEEPIGTRPEPDARRRGWIELPAVSPSPDVGSPLLILQHPSGEPMKLALDGSVLGTNENGTRVRYTTDTLGGSSGSPCFTAEWVLVALHHAGDPDFDPSHRPEYNEGIPMAAIRARLDRRGLSEALSPVPA